LPEGKFVRHAILGAGGIGGLIATILSAGGDDVTAVVRAAAAATEPREYELERADGTVRASVTIASALGPDDVIDVLWVTPKATQLRDALTAVASARPRAVVPLLNGVDHLATLRETFGEAVIPATIAVGAEKLAPGRFRQTSVFAALMVSERGRAPLGAAAGILERARVGVVFHADENSMMWKKLVGLSVLALTTSAALSPIGPLRDHPRWRPRIDAAIAEVVAVARAAGADLGEADARMLVFGAPADLKSSMLRDVEAGREPELDAISGVVIRHAEHHDIPVPAIRALTEDVRANYAAITAGTAPSPAAPTPRTG